MFKLTYPFSAIVGQENLKLSILLNVINPKIGGVLIKGQRGTSKSTCVRSISPLLPKNCVYRDCPFRCGPEDKWICKHCIETCKNEIVYQKINVINLPLNATEDMVVGSIDFEYTLKCGKIKLLPGILAKANKNILYIDEVNLLHDHIIDIILTASSSGFNLIERESLSFIHPSRFILIGTMNPEEGSLSPQLLDRFGLCVEITGEVDIEKRVKIMKRREEYDLSPYEFIKKFKTKEKELSENIANSIKILKSVKTPSNIRKFIAELCEQNNVAGHRAEIVMEQAAKAYAAMNNRYLVNIDDVLKISNLVLNHRKRDNIPPSSSLNNNKKERKNKNHKNRDRSKQDKKNNRTNNINKQNPKPFNDNEKKDNATNKKDKAHDTEQIFEIGQTFCVKPILFKKDKIFRKGSGRRSKSLVSLKQGRYVRAIKGDIKGDIALDATIRCAAPYQKDRRKYSSRKLAILLNPQDIMVKIRERRIGNFILFVVDASGSMGARGRMVASKGAIMSLLLDAYQKRDKISMISFRKKQATLNLPPTSSIELSAKYLREMPVGGRTPLSIGLKKAYIQLKSYLTKDPTARPICIIITDGKANWPMDIKNDPIKESMLIASKMSKDPRIMYLVVDTEEHSVLNLGLAKQLACILKAKYFKIEDLKSDKLLNIIKENIKC